MWKERRADNLLDPENPPPGGAVGQDAAEHGTQHAGHGNDAAAKPANCLHPAHGRDLRQDDHGQTIEPGSADALQRAKNNELLQRAGAAAANREPGKQHKGGQKRIAAAKDVGELREGDGEAEVAQGVGEDDPVDGVEAVELGSDGKQAGRHDGSVEHREEEAEVEAERR